MRSIILKIPTDILVSLFSVWILKEYLNLFFIQKKRRVLSFCAWGVFFAWQIKITWSNNLPFYANMLINTSIIVFIITVAYSGNLLKRLSLSIIYFIIWVIVEFVAALILLLCKVDFLLPIPQLFISISSKAIMLLVISLLKHFFKKEKIQRGFEDHKYIIPVLVSVIGLWVVLFFIIFIHPFGEVSIILSIIILIISITVFVIYRKVLDTLEVQYNTAVNIYKEQLSLYKKHTLENEVVMMTIRKMEHDINHHFISLTEFLDKQEWEGMGEYLKDVICDYESARVGISYTGNIAVDASVNYKYTIAKEKEIDFRANIIIPMILPFDNPDLSVVIGNALDNAIEATLKLPVNERFIKVTMGFFVEKDYQRLEMEFENSFDGDVRKNQSGGFLTTKVDNGNHGIGINSMIHIAKKYDGYCKAKSRGNVFFLKIALYATK